MKFRITVFTLIIGIMATASLSSCQQDNRTKVLISTDYGDIKVVLYDETPQHRDNFVKLVNEGWYNGSIFHRVIDDFMIQGGWNAEGQKDPGYTVPAEFNPALYHKKGVLAAARQPDQVNPQKASSGCQFYIVEGQVFDDNMLNNFESQSGLTYTEEQRNAYKTIGGTPHLDGDYTVFGEVLEGLDVVEKIASVKTAGQANKPVADVKMTMKIVK